LRYCIQILTYVKITQRIKPMKNITIITLILISINCLAFEIPNKCEPKKKEFNLSEEVEIQKHSLIFTQKPKIKNSFGDTSAWDATQHYLTLLDAIEKSMVSHEKRYDFAAKINNFHFKSEASCMKLSRIRRYLKASGVFLPDVPKVLKKEVTVAIIDTGIDLKNFELTKRMIIPTKLSDLDFSETSLQDTNGHGSHVAGLILAVFPYAKILPLKYYNPKARGIDNLHSTVAAVNYAIEHNVDIINYSGGGPHSNIEELSALRKAEEKGIIIVSAAGNNRSNIDHHNTSYFPASYDLKNQIVVGNLDRSNRRAPSSNFGKNSIDIFAFGSNSLSFGLDYECSDYMTGTSQATPLVAGALALMMASNPKMSPLDAKEAVIKQTRAIKELTEISKNGLVLDLKEIAQR
jgi:hypothetical protein